MSLVKVLVKVRPDNLIMEFVVDQDNPFLIPHCRLILSNCGVYNIAENELVTRTLRIIAEKIAEKFYKKQYYRLSSLAGIGCIDGTTGMKFIGMSGSFDSKEQWQIISSEISDEKIIENITEVTDEH